MPTQKRASLGEILEAAKAWLAEYLSFPIDRIKVIVPDGRQRPVPKFTAPVDMLIEAGGLVADPENCARHDCRVSRELIITVRSRLARDTADRDDQWMLDSSGGSIVWEDAVVDALQLECLEDSARNMLTFEGIKLIRSNPRSHIEGDASWGEVKLTFGVPHRLALTQRG